MTVDRYIAAEPTGWRYECAPDRGAKVQLLTIGGVTVIGTWYGAYGQYFTAWAPLLKRYKLDS